MPSNFNKYSNGKIYNLRSKQIDKIYIGSTTTTLENRFKKHKNDFNRYKKEKFSYVTSFELLKYEDCKINLIKEFPCNYKSELFDEEGRIQRENKEIIVNKIIQGRTDKQYREDNKEKIKKYREDNKEKMKSYAKQYQKENKEQIKNHRKEYWSKNKEQINEKRKGKNKTYGKKYREKNKDQIKKYKKEYWRKKKDKLMKN